MDDAPFQDRVQPWMRACFGPKISADKVERGDRLLEEVFELLQAGGYDPARVLSLREYVWGREVGNPEQEAGGVMVTLAAYCLAHGLDMHDAGETELARIWTRVDKIRAKQAAKPKHSPLPVASSPAAADAGEPAKALRASDILREWFGGDRYARDYEYLDQWFGGQAERVAAYIRSAIPVTSTAPTHRHKKRGTEYTVLLEGRLQVDGDLDDEKVVVYQGEDGAVWVRPTYEFNDGRFEELPPAPRKAKGSK